MCVVGDINAKGHCIQFERSDLGQWGKVVKYNNYSCPLPNFSTVLSKPTLFVLSSKRIVFFHMAFAFFMVFCSFNTYLLAPCSLYSDYKI